MNMYQHCTLAYLCQCGGGGGLAFIHFQPGLYPPRHSPPPLIFNICFPSAELSVYVVCVCVCVCGHHPSLPSCIYHILLCLWPPPPPPPPHLPPSPGLSVLLCRHPPPLSGWQLPPEPCQLSLCHQRDGPMTIDGNEGESSLVTPPFRVGSWRPLSAGGAPNYFPNSFTGPDPLDHPSHSLSWTIVVCTTDGLLDIVILVPLSRV